MALVDAIHLLVVIIRFSCCFSVKKFMKQVQVRENSPFSKIYCSSCPTYFMLYVLCFSSLL